MPANPYGVNGPRMGKTHGRLRNSMLNQLSKMAGQRQAYPLAVTARPAATAVPAGDQGVPNTPQAPQFQVQVPPQQARGLGQTAIPLSANATPVLDLSSGTAALSQAAQNLVVLAQLAGTGGQGSGNPGPPAGDGGGQPGGDGPPGNRPPVPHGLDNVEANMRLGRWMAANRGWGADQWKYIRYIVEGHGSVPGESNWLGSADNPTSSAIGIGQRLVHAHPWLSDAEKYHYLHNVQYQIAWMYNYIKERYGSPEAAWKFKTEHHWY